MSLNNFAHPAYQEHNRARLDHLASLGFDLFDKSVLEIGSGPGDHTGFYVSRGCIVTSVDARAECLNQLHLRFPSVGVRQADMNEPLIMGAPFDLIHCYGLLYHLERPEVAIQSMAAACGGLLFLETCVSIGDYLSINLIPEGAQNFTQAHGRFGCRPTRRWVFEELKKHFPFVYQTVTQPMHPEFPIDWGTIRSGHGLIRIVLVASHAAVNSPLLHAGILEQQRY